MRDITYFEMMEPMRYYDNPEPTSLGAIQKRNDMINDLNGQYIASVKHDGDWGLFIHYSKGHNLIRSRSISKVTGVYGDYTAKVPHLAEAMDYLPDNTAFLAELCFKEYGTNANTVGTILRCLPEKAIERQKKTPLYAFIFDVLMYDGQDLMDTPYESRILDFAPQVVDWIPYDYIQRTDVFYDGIDFAEAADEIISAGGEGIVIQLKSNPYMPGTRTAWKTLKMKQSLPHMDLKVVNFIEPNKLYEGDFSADWPYKLDDGTLVTKPYFYHWKNGVIVQLPSGETTSVTSGLTDEDREWLASDEAAEIMAKGDLWAEVKAMSVNDLGKLRHAALVRLRTDI